METVEALLVGANEDEAQEASTLLTGRFPNLAPKIYPNLRQGVHDQFSRSAQTGLVWIFCDDITRINYDLGALTEFASRAPRNQFKRFAILSRSALPKDTRKRRAKKDSRTEAEWCLAECLNGQISVMQATQGDMRSLLDPKPISKLTPHLRYVLGEAVPVFVQGKGHLLLPRQVFQIRDIQDDQIHVSFHLDGSSEQRGHIPFQTDLLVIGSLKQSSVPSQLGAIEGFYLNHPAGELDAVEWPLIGIPGVFPKNACANGANLL